MTVEPSSRRSARRVLGGQPDHRRRAELPGAGGSRDGSPALGAELPGPDWIGVDGSGSLLADASGRVRSWAAELRRLRRPPPAPRFWRAWPWQYPGGVAGAAL